MKIRHSNSSISKLLWGTFKNNFKINYFLYKNNLTRSDSYLLSYSLHSLSSSILSIGFLLLEPWTKNFGHKKAYLPLFLLKIWPLILILPTLFVKGFLKELSENNSFFLLIIEKDYLSLYILKKKTKIKFLLLKKMYYKFSFIMIYTLFIFKFF